MSEASEARAAADADQGEAQEQQARGTKRAKKPPKPPAVEVKQEGTRVKVKVNEKMVRLAGAAPMAASSMLVDAVAVRVRDDKRPINLSKYVAPGAREFREEVVAQCAPHVELDMWTAVGLAFAFEFGSALFALAVGQSIAAANISPEHAKNVVKSDAFKQHLKQTTGLDADSPEGADMVNAALNLMQRASDARGAEAGGAESA